MANVPRPLPAGTVLRFGSLDFVATGNGFDMELLPPKANPDTPTLPTRRNRRSGQRARQVRMGRRRAARLSSPMWVEADVSQPSVAASGVATSSPRAPALPVLTPPPNAPPEPPKEGATATYASSISTSMSTYEDLPGHHLLSIRNLIASSPDDSYPDTAGSIADDINFFMDNFTTTERDYSRVRDLNAFRSFQLTADYCLTCSKDSSGGITIPPGSASWSSWRMGWLTKR